jgi:hypothetical protein
VRVAIYARVSTRIRPVRTNASNCGATSQQGVGRCSANTWIKASAARRNAALLSMRWCGTRSGGGSTCCACGGWIAWGATFGT